MKASGPLDAIQFLLPALKPHELKTLMVQLGMTTHTCQEGHKFKSLGKRRGWFGSEFFQIYCERCGVTLTK